MADIGGRNVDANNKQASFVDGSDALLAEKIADKVSDKKSKIGSKKSAAAKKKDLAESQQSDIQQNDSIQNNTHQGEIVTDGGASENSESKAAGKRDSIRKKDRNSAPDDIQSSSEDRDADLQLTLPNGRRVIRRAKSKAPELPAPPESASANSLIEKMPQATQLSVGFQTDARDNDRVLDHEPQQGEDAESFRRELCTNGHELEPDEQSCMLCGLSERAESVQKRIRDSKLSIDEGLLSRVLFSKSRRDLEVEWQNKRALFPDSEHELIRSLLERKNLSEEDLIILIAAAHENFIPAEQVLDKALALSNQVFSKRARRIAGHQAIKFEKEILSEFLALSKAQICDEIDSRIEGFARCGIELIDAWADNYRLENQMPLERCLLMLAVPKELWLQLPKQEYVAEILKFGERRIMATINQGPLVYLRITKTSSTLDITELGWEKKSPRKILESLLAVNPTEIEIDQELLKIMPGLERRIRNLVQKTTVFKRDTGKHGLYLGFPFIAMRTRSADDTKTKLRVAPVLLFPARIDAQLGNKGKIIVSSSDNDEIRLNPALPGILGLCQPEEDRWREALEQILEKDEISPEQIIDIFSQFCQCADSSLGAVPGKEFVSELDKPLLSYSAALFHCDFAGKAVADDLRNISGIPMAGTALELALRLRDRKQEDNEAESRQAEAFDLEDYAVIAADPSQEAAVQQSRMPSGLHIEGPPGTGKSQTIVNIIADCVARNETVLVVCQKQAALSVVERRLKAEGLGRRLFFITDISKDRQSVVRALREQLDERHAGLGSPLAQLRKERAGLVTRIQAIEAELNRHHAALHGVDDFIGLSYRSVLAELIQIESAESFLVKIPRLRSVLKDYDNAGVLALSEECASIAQLWVESKYEISPLQDLKPFAPDHADVQMISTAFMSFMKAEEQRFKTLNEYPRSVDVDDITIYVSWLRENEEYIREIPKDVRLNLSRWVGHFFAVEPDKASVGSQAIKTLTDISESLSKLNKYDHSPALFIPLASISQVVLKKYLSIAKSATAEGGFITEINPMRAFNRFRLRNILRSYQQRSNDKTMFEFLRAALLEKELRAYRKVYEQISKNLGLETAPQALDLYHLQHAVSVLLTQLAPVAELAAKLQTCPLLNDAKEFAGKSEPGAFEEFNSVLKGVIKRHAAKTESLNCLSHLAQWFDEEWLQAQRRVISAGKGNIEASRHMQRFLPTIIPFQEFRLRSRTMSSHALEVLAALREHESELLSQSNYGSSQELNTRTDAFLAALSGQAPAVETDSSPHIDPGQGPDLVKRIGRVIRREACLTWKSILETKEPVLTISKEEIHYKVKSLAESEELLRNLNRRILAEPHPELPIAQSKKWEDLTRLSGARARRLRELVANGAELGLMNLRPVWLMNPETASRMLPLKPGLFDAVIFDEASQLLVEYALPTLFRAKRAIVSGDEKQMPPANFFASRVQSDEAFSLDEDEIDEMLPQAERDRIEESWNRREIKDCPDLLNLASAVLPSRSLQIHYRSSYRELIAFSNAAFYSGTLSIPSKHPANVVRKSRPIEVISVNTVYEKQVNHGEALKIAELLQKIWSLPASKRPTVGVVSFNLKQADLIEEVLEDLARKDESFRAAFEEESKRTEDGEDLGFFVKNLENVQGDERDIIIFSTTFGFDSTGFFRRNFGKLGQDGGERRLNVAITRARLKVVLVTSLPVEKISEYLGRTGNPAIPRDYFQAYLDYAVKISRGALDAANASLRRLAASEDPRARLDLKHDDPFIMDVADFVSGMGYELVTRNDAGDAFEIDIAVENPKTGLFGIGIECDAPSHRLLSTAKHRELWRQSVLARSIPKIHRINSRDWYQRKERERELLRGAILQAFAQGES